MAQAPAAGYPAAMAEVSPELLRAAQELLAREGLAAFQAVADKALTAAPAVCAPQCAKKHDLQRQAKGMGDWLSGVTCDVCSGSAFNAGDMWSCRPCDYDECGICAARIKCPNGIHLLIKKKSGIGDWISGMTCDECKQNPWNSGAVWSCRECDYDQCNKCMEAKSLSFENGTSPAPSPKNSVSLPAAAIPQAAPAPVAVASAPSPKSPTRSDSKEPEAAEDTTLPPASEAATIKKARDEALARKRAIEERMAADAASLMEEEQHLDDIRKKLGEADKVRQRSECLRSSIEASKREIRRLEMENERRKDAVKQAQDAAMQAAAMQLAVEGQLGAKREQCQQLEQEMVDYLLQVDQQKKDEENGAEADENGSPSGSHAEGSAPAADGASPPPPPPSTETQ